MHSFFFFAGQSARLPGQMSQWFSERFDWRSGQASLSWQLLWIAAVWAYVAGLHFDNNGLWFQGDAPRHVANGLFWLDLIREVPNDIKDFALGYYARYPVIHPTAHPPGFYLLEAVAFAIFGASPYVAKALILGFGLVATIYLTLWLRRWLSPEAGWASSLLVLQPAVIVWSNTVMLNVPSLAIGLGALWHARRWLEEPRSRHVFGAIALPVLGFLVYMTTGVVAFIMGAWLVAERRWGLLKDYRAWIVGIPLGLLVVPWMMVVFRWAPAHVSSIYVTGRPLLTSVRWTFYFTVLPELFTGLLLGLAALGAALGLISRRDRRETRFVLIWVLVCYFMFSYFIAREQRYVMLLGPAAVILASVGLWQMSRWAAARLSVPPPRVFLGAVAIVTAVHLWQAASVRVPPMHGMKEVVTFLRGVAPEEMLFYDGQYDGVFSFYVQASDPDFKSGVVVGHKLLYASSIFARFNLKEFVSSPKDVVERLQAGCGCQWLAIERSGWAEEIAAAAHLREAVRGPEFELVKSFAIDGPHAFQIDVYRFKFPGKPGDHIELNFPALREGSQLRVKPIRR